MKTIIVSLGFCLLQIHATAQADKRPVIVEDSVAHREQAINLFANYADQGNVIYFNNSLFYNKDNNISNNAPLSNGHYE